jgi:ABC-type amino acid transport substrate-binding protein
MRGLPVALGLWAAIASAVVALDLPEIHKRGKLVALVAGNPGDSSRFCTKRGSEFVGIEGEILAGFARQQKLELEMAYVPGWDALVPSLLQKKGDVVAGGMTSTEQRRKVIDFTAETFPTRDVVVTRRPRRVVETVEQLREEVVGVAAGTSYVDAAKAAGVPAANLKVIGDNASVDQLMRAGTITATVQGVEFALAPDEADPDVQLGMFLGPPQSIALGVRKDDPQLLLALNDYITNLRRTPTWNRLVVKYFGDKAVDVLKRARGE